MRQEILETRSSEREAMLRDLVRQLEEDPRIFGTWLHGSLGRGTADAWSDIDIWVVVENEHFSSVIEARYEEVARIGQLVLTVESPQNAPPRGIHLMSGHDRSSGLHLIDWYLQPRSVARLPAEGKILFMRGELPDVPALNDPPLVAWFPTPEEERANLAALAWAMIAIQAKHIARKPEAEGMAFHDFIASLIAKALNDDTLQNIGSPPLQSSTERIRSLLDMIDSLRVPGPRSSLTNESVNAYLSTVQRFRCET